MGLVFSSGHRACALLVDGTRGERELHVKYLTQHGIGTVEAEDGLHGIAKAASQLPDVIAVDLGIADDDIVDMCYRLKRDDFTSYIPIVAISPICNVDQVNRAMRAGCVSVLLKPCLPNELLEEIHRVLGLPGPAA